MVEEDSAKLTSVQPQSTSYEANLYTFHMRHRHDADPVRHGRCQRHHHSGELAHVRSDMISIPQTASLGIVHVEAGYKILRSGAKVYMYRN